MLTEVQTERQRSVLELMAVVRTEAPSLLPALDSLTKLGLDAGISKVVAPVDIEAVGLRRQDTQACTCLEADGDTSRGEGIATLLRALKAPTGCRQST